MSRISKILFLLLPPVIAAADPSGAHVPPPVHMITVAPAQPMRSGGDYEQRLYGPGARHLVAPERAQEIVARFRETNEDLGSPRYLVYVNRDLVDRGSGERLSGRSEKRETVATERSMDFTPAPGAAAPAAAATPTTVVSAGAVTLGPAGTQEWAAGEGRATSSTTVTTSTVNSEVVVPAAASLADRQTTREIERLFGRPLRLAGASLADQAVALQMLADRPLAPGELTAEGSEAARGREVLSRHADVVVEILVSARRVVLQEVSGPRVVEVPDIQATAVRLSDARILGQASSTDVLGVDRTAAVVARTFDVRQIAEATALALLQDLALSAAGPVEGGN